MIQTEHGRAGRKEAAGDSRIGENSRTSDDDAIASSESRRRLLESALPGAPVVRGVAIPVVRGVAVPSALDDSPPFLHASQLLGLVREVTMTRTGPRCRN